MERCTKDHETLVTSELDTILWTAHTRENLIGTLTITASRILLLISRSMETFTEQIPTRRQAQEDLIKEIAKLHKPLIIVYIEGRPLLNNTANEVANAILTAFYPGEQGGNAIADVIFGNYNPAGRLPISQPRNTGQIPIYYSQPKPHNYLECESSPLFCFGYGLSYTDFEYKNLIINKLDKEIEVSIDVTNIGEHDGDEVVQLYLRDEYATITPAEKLLKGFKRVFIQKDDTQHVTFTIPTQNLESGEFTIMVGASSDDIRLKEKIVI